MGEGRVDPLGRVHAPAGEPVAQGLGRQVDDLDLVRLAEHAVGDRLALRHPGDLLDHVVERGDVLDVDGGDHVDAGVADEVHVLPALLGSAAGCVRVGELVDQRDGRSAGDDRVHVEVGDLHPAVRHLAPGQDLQPLEHRRRGGAAVGLHDRDHHVGALVAQPPALLEHRVGLAHAGRRSQQHPQSTALHVSSPCPRDAGVSRRGRRARCSARARSRSAPRGSRGRGPARARRRGARPAARGCPGPPRRATPAPERIPG